MTSGSESGDLMRCQLNEVRFRKHEVRDASIAASFLTLAFYRIDYEKQPTLPVYDDLRSIRR